MDPVAELQLPEDRDDVGLDRRLSDHALFVTDMVLEELAKGPAGDTGPSGFAEEIGILATGTVLMTAGLLPFRSAATA